jgi:hypothetical protein
MVKRAYKRGCDRKYNAVEREAQFLYRGEESHRSEHGRDAFFSLNCLDILSEERRAIQTPLLN